MNKDLQLSLTGKEWILPERTSLATHELPKTSLAQWLCQLLYQRGIQNEESIESYLNTSLQSLADPRLMADMDKAVARLQKAISADESIVIYGDYDVDGVCSTTILVEFLRSVGATVSFYIPDRKSEGYDEGKIFSVVTRGKLLALAIP